MVREIKGWHVFLWFALAFGTIVAVNLTLAFNAVRTFPGLEVKNSYVASQNFDAERTAQIALGWQVSAIVENGQLRLEFLEQGQPVAPAIESAIFGRATSTAADQDPEFRFDGQAFTAPVNAGPGNWNLRVKARAGDGTLFHQRIIVQVLK
ncbi:MAG: FixH family protein [Rhodobacter sp.]|nr:FixH family protein [Rhodobacter sp.]